MTKIRSLALMLAAAMLFPVFTFFAFTSEGAEAPEETKLYAETSEILLFPENSITVEEYTDESFKSDNNGYDLSYDRFRNRKGLYLARDDGGTLPVTVSKNYSEPLDLSSYEELFFQLRISAEEGETIDVTVTLSSWRKKYTVTTTIECGSIYDVYCPLTNFDERSAVTGISFSFNGEMSPERLAISSIFADSKYTYSYKTRFSADDLYSPNEMRRSEKCVYLTPSDSKVQLSAVIDNNLGNTGTILVRTVVSNAAAGSITLSINDGDTSEYRSIAALTLFPGSNAYTFMYDARRGTHAYRLELSGVSTEDGAEIAIESVNFTHLDGSLSDISQPHIGSISSCNLTSDKKNVRISGTLQSSAVINNINASIGVYAVDMQGNNKTEILSTIDISTVFEITADISGLNINPYLCAFYVALVDGDRITPIANPVYPAIPSSSKGTQNTALGVQSDDSSVPFLSNVGQTVVDIDLSKLCSSDASGGRNHMYNGRIYYLNSSYIKELDSKINFNLNSGVDVLLRIISKIPTDAERPGAYLTVRVKDADSAMKYTALLDFLTARYSRVSGVIVGSRIDSLIYNYGSFDGILAYCRNYAELLRLTSTVVRANTAGAVVIAPFGDGYIYSEDRDIKGDFFFKDSDGMGESSADPMIVSEVVSQMISKNGAFQWYIMYECESEPVRAMNYAYKMYTQLTQGNGASPYGYYLLWQPESQLDADAAADGISEIAKEALTLSPRGAILSLTRADCDDVAAAGKIKGIKHDEKSQRQNYSADALVAEYRDGTLPLWDFRYSFSTGGFVGGGAVVSLTTETSKRMSELLSLSNCRALHAALSPNLSASAVIISYFDSPKNLDAASSIDVTLCINSDSQNECPVKIIFGKNNTRLEYSATVPTGKPITLKCPINKSQYPAPSEYMALEVSPDSVSSFDILSVDAVSEMPADKLETALTSSENGKGDGLYNNRSVTAVLVFTVITLVGFALFSVKTTGKQHSAPRDGHRSTAGGR